MLRYGWTLDREHWNVVKSEVIEATWRRVKFVYDSCDLIPQGRGIYLVVLDARDIISSTPFNSFSSPLYVGHATKLRQRFKQHTIGSNDSNLRRRMSKFSNCMYFHFAEFRDYPKDELKFLEQSLINVFGPPLNSINSISPGVLVEKPTEGKLDQGEQ